MRSNGSDRVYPASHIFVVMAACVLAMSFMACDSGPPSSPAFVDMARVAEALRARETQLEASCDEGFQGFVGATKAVLLQVTGSRNVVDGIASFQNPSTRDPSGLSDPALLRLVIQRYGAVCSGPRGEEIREDLARLAEGEASAEELRDALRRRLKGIDVAIQAVDGAVVIVDMPPSSDGVADEGERGSRGIEEDVVEPVTFLTCLKCPEEERLDGPRQIAATIGAFDAIASSGVVVVAPLRLVVCMDASRKPESCAERFDSSTRRSRAAFALDGTEPLVVSWSAEVSWHLEVDHRRPDDRWMAAARAQAKALGGGAPFVIDAGAEGTLDQLPAEAWMLLFDPRRTSGELVSRVEAEVVALETYRQGAEFSVGSVEESDDGADLVRVTVRREPRPAWEIGEGENTLWDLAALAGALRAVDPPQGGCAAMLRVVERFDGDSNGRRLGLSYSDPIGGPLLVAPCTLTAREQNVVLAIRMYRPPGLERSAFLRRLDDARARLRHAAGRTIGQAERMVGDPSSVEPQSDMVGIIKQVIEEVTGTPVLSPSGSPRPGLGQLLPQAVSLRPPTQESTVSAHPEIAFLIDLMWFTAIATEPEVRQASLWQ